MLTKVVGPTPFIVRSPQQLAANLCQLSGRPCFDLPLPLPLSLVLAVVQHFIAIVVAAPAVMLIIYITRAQQVPLL